MKQILLFLMMSITLYAKQDTTGSLPFCYRIYQEHDSTTKTRNDILDAYDNRDVVTLINNYYTNEYPSFFHPLSKKKLSRLYPPSGHQTILVPRATNLNRSTVYTYLSGKKWIERLHNMSQKGYTFLISAKVVAIIEDPTISNRYLVLYNEEWKNMFKERAVFQSNTLHIASHDVLPNGTLSSKQVIRRGIYTYSSPSEAPLTDSVKAAYFSYDYDKLFRKSNLAGFPSDIINPIEVLFLKYLSEEKWKKENN